MTLVEGLPGGLKRIATGLPIARRASRVPVDRAADAGKLRFYVDILHPTDAHFFHHFIDDMRARGHEFLVASREKECAVDLLDGFGIPTPWRAGRRMAPRDCWPSSVAALHLPPPRPTASTPTT